MKTKISLLVLCISVAFTAGCDFKSLELKSIVDTAAHLVYESEVESMVLYDLDKPHLQVEITEDDARYYEGLSEMSQVKFMKTLWVQNHPEESFPTRVGYDLPEEVQVLTETANATVDAVETIPGGGPLAGAILTNVLSLLGLGYSSRKSKKRQRLADSMAQVLTQVVQEEADNPNADTDGSRLRAKADSVISSKLSAAEVAQLQNTLRAEKIFS